MPGCILHVSGADFAVDAFLADSRLRPYRVHHRGDVSHRSKCHLHSGFSVDVSTADGDLPTEVADAIAFLTTHEAELQRLRDFPGVMDLRLDFACYHRDVAAQFEYFPPDLLARAGSLGMGIALSLYSSPQLP